MVELFYYEKKILDPPYKPTISINKIIATVIAVATNDNIKFKGGGKSMTHAEVVSEIASRTSLKKVEVASVIEELKSVIVSTVKGGDDVSVTGLGKFVLQTKGARTARNPKTGETVNVAEKNVLKFKPTSKMAEELN